MDDEYTSRRNAEADGRYEDRQWEKASAEGAALERARCAAFCEMEGLYKTALAIRRCEHLPKAQQPAPTPTSGIVCNKWWGPI